MRDYQNYGNLGKMSSEEEDKSKDSGEDSEKGSGDEGSDADSETANDEAKKKKVSFSNKSQIEQIISSLDELNLDISLKFGSSLGLGFSNQSRGGRFDRSYAGS